MDDNKMYLIKIREIMEYFLTCSCFQKGCNFIDSIIIIITINVIILFIMDIIVIIIIIIVIIIISIYIVTNNF